MEAGCNCEPFWWIERINAILSLSPHFRVGVCFDTVRESACMACKRSAVRSRYSPPKKHCTSFEVRCFSFLFQQKDQGVHRSPCRRASDTPDLHNSRHLPRRFNRGFRGQHGAGPTAPAPAWQALAGARAVRQRGRRRKKKFLRRKVCVAAVVSPGKMARRFTSFWERSI